MRLKLQSIAKHAFTTKCKKAELTLTFKIQVLNAPLPDVKLDLINSNFFLWKMQTNVF